jgi:hypothetical protein
MLYPQESTDVCHQAPETIRLIAVARSGAQRRRMSRAASPLSGGAGSIRVLACVSIQPTVYGIRMRRFATNSHVPSCLTKIDVL